MSLARPSMKKRQQSKTPTSTPEETSDRDRSSQQSGLGACGSFDPALVNVHFRLLAALLKGLGFRV